MTNLSKLSSHIVSNQFTLYLGNEITVVIVDYKANRTVAPFGCTIELSKPLAMFFV